MKNCTLFWWFNFSKYQGWYPNANVFSRSNIQLSTRLTILRKNVSSTCIFTYHSKGKRSLNEKTLASYNWHLKTIWNSQQFKIPLKDVLNLVFVCKEISPRYGNNIRYGMVIGMIIFFSIVVISAILDQIINSCFKTFGNK